MGARPAHNKSLTLGSTPQLRKWLKKQRWGTGQLPIPTTSSTRDLGAFLNMSSQRLAGTLKARMQHGCTDAVKIGALPRTLQDKDRMLRTKACAKASYGVEATEPKLEDKRKFASACASALVGRHQTQRAPEVVIAMAGLGSSSMDVTMLTNRWHLLRRAWYLRPKWKRQIMWILQKLTGPAAIPPPTPPEHMTDHAQVPKAAMQQCPFHVDPTPSEKVRGWQAAARGSGACTSTEFTKSPASNVQHAHTHHQRSRGLRAPPFHT